MGRDVDLAAYDPRWPARFAREARAVAQALAPVVDVQHVGSTSVPGLAAKPTIDIAVAVVGLRLPERAWAEMERIGYRYGGDHGLPQHVFRKGERMPWAFLVHVVEAGGEMWRDYLAFRDRLRAHPEDAAEYERLKRALLRELGGWYSGRDKDRFIRAALDHV